jgi:hypothetical protein
MLRIIAAALLLTSLFADHCPSKWTPARYRRHAVESTR